MRRLRAPPGVRKVVSGAGGWRRRAAQLDAIVARKLCECEQQLACRTHIPFGSERERAGCARCAVLDSDGTRSGSIALENLRQLLERGGHERRRPFDNGAARLRRERLAKVAVAARRQAPAVGK